MKAPELEAVISSVLRVPAPDDPALNGLQIESDRAIGRVALAVSATDSAVDYAIAHGADALVVHHGLLWDGPAAALVGTRGQLVRKVVAAELSLLAFHLPLDADPTAGNSVGLLQALSVASPEPVAGTRGLGFAGELDQALTPDEFLTSLLSISCEPIHVQGNLPRSINRIGTVTGSGAGFAAPFELASIDAFVTGEISLSRWDAMRDTSFATVSIGHTSSEQFGVELLAGLLSRDHRMDTVVAPLSCSAPRADQRGIYSVP